MTFLEEMEVAIKPKEKKTYKLESDARVDKPRTQQ